MNKIQFSIEEDFRQLPDGTKYTLSDKAAAQLMSYFTKFSIVRLLILALMHMLNKPEHYANVNKVAMQELATHCKAFASFQEQN